VTGDPPDHPHVDVIEEGWFVDPFHLHEDRWISAGRPSDLVRDHGNESRSAPPDLPMPTPLVRVTPAANGSAQDVMRADGAQLGPRPARADYLTVAFEGGVVNAGNPLLMGTSVSSDFETPYQRKARLRARHARWSRRWHRLIRR